MEMMEETKKQATYIVTLEKSTLANGETDGETHTLGRTLF